MQFGMLLESVRLNEGTYRRGVSPPSVIGYVMLFVAAYKVQIHTKNTMSSGLRPIA